MRASKSYVLASLVLLLACNDEGEKGPLPDWSDGYEEPTSDGGISDAGHLPIFGTLAMEIPESVQYPVRLYRKGNQNLPCAIDEQAAADFEERDIECMLDINELDLFVLGFEYRAVAADGMCDFVLHGGPMFATFPVGMGPAVVSYTRHEDDSVSEEVNAEAGQPKCPFDHAPNGPDCCYGDYILVVTSAATGLETVSHHSWGQIGDLAECYEGGAFYGSDLPIAGNGFPADRIVHVDRGGYSDIRAFGGISGTHPRISYPLANFYDPDDHGGQAPEPFLAPGAREHYELTCLDDAEEIVARIRLTVREWNEVREHERSGDPDTEGTEPDWETPINDLLDWKDVAAIDEGDFPLVRRPEAMNGL